MNRRLKTVLLLGAPTVLYAAGRAYFLDMLPEALVFVVIFVGIISYGYLIMPDEELENKMKARMLMPFAVACAGVTAIGKVSIDARLAHSLPGASIAAASIWGGLIAYLAIRTPLFKSDK
jgi:hypothetical protein